MIPIIVVKGSKIFTINDKIKWLLDAGTIMTQNTAVEIVPVVDLREGKGMSEFNNKRTNVE